MPRHTTQITLRAIITARWVMLGLLTYAGIAAWVFPEVGLGLMGWAPSHRGPLVFLCAVAAWCGLNLATALTLDKVPDKPRFAGLHLVVDVVVLSVLLALSGGARNPFTVVYFLPLTLATQVSPRWTWTIAVTALVCFGSLFFLSAGAAIEPIIIDEWVGAGGMDHGGMDHGDMDHGDMDHGDMDHGDSPFTNHLFGMWIAFGVTGTLMTFFVHRIALSLRDQRAEVERLRAVHIEDRHLGAIGALAAGAAHELGTPLNTITVLAGELEHMDDDERGQAVRSIAAQAKRCKSILGRMASPELRADDLAAGSIVPWRLGSLEQELAEIAGEVPLRIGRKVAQLELTLAQAYVGQVLRELVANASRASTPGGEPIVIDGARSDGELWIEVRDHGTGMDEDAIESAFEPLTTDRTEGMGLGLYLARAHVRRIGGRLTLESQPGRGTTARLVLPTTDQGDT